QAGAEVSRPLIAAAPLVLVAAAPGRGVGVGGGAEGLEAGRVDAAGGRVDLLDRAARAATIAGLEVAVVAGLDTVDDAVATHAAGTRAGADDAQLVDVPAA